MCRVLQVSRSSQYVWRNRRQLMDMWQPFRQHCDTAVSTVFHQAKQRDDSPSLTEERREQGMKFNVKTMAASLRRQGLREKHHENSYRPAIVNTA